MLWEADVDEVVSTVDPGGAPESAGPGTLEEQAPSATAIDSGIAILATNSLAREAADDASHRVPITADAPWESARPASEEEKRDGRGGLGLWPSSVRGATEEDVGAAEPAARFGSTSEVTARPVWEGEPAPW